MILRWVRSVLGLFTYFAAGDTILNTGPTLHFLTRMLGLGLQEGRLLCAERPHHPGAHRPRDHPFRCCSWRQALEVLRPGRRILYVRLLRQVPAPAGLRAVPVLSAEGLK